MSARNWKNPGTTRWDEDLRVTPLIASYWLEHTSAMQAKVRQKLVEKYALMRRANLWNEDNDSPIKIDTKGEVIDGKHRLWMVVETDLPTYFHVHHNVPTEVYNTTDTGRLRGLDDVGYARFHGDKKAAAITKAMADTSYNGTSATLSANLPLMRAFQEQHEDAIAFSRGLFGTGKKGITAPVMAAVAKASYYVPRHELMIFVDRLYSGVIVDEGEVAVIRLRDFLFTQSSTARGSSWRRDTYLKTGRAIQLFVRRQSIRHLYAAGADPFPLPA